MLQKYWAVSATGVLHVGAHKAEESVGYDEAGWGHVYWVEAQPNMVSELRSQLNISRNTVIELAAWDSEIASMTLHVTNNSESTSLLEMGTHRVHYPHISVMQEVKVRAGRLDKHLPKGANFDFVNLDIQGAELQALKGLEEYMPQVQWIYSEINFEDLYVGGTTIYALDDFLKRAGFVMVARMRVPKVGWGDGLWIRKEIRTNRFKSLLGRSHLRLIYLYRAARSGLKFVIRQLKNWAS